MRMGDFFSAAFRSSRIPDGDWEEAAASLGLTLDRTLAGADAVFGSRGDIDVAIGHMTHGDRLITRYRMQFAGLPFGLQILAKDQEPVFDVRSSLPSATTGHDSLDNRLVTRTDDPGLLQQWLSPERVRLIVDLYNTYRPMEVSSVAVTYHSQLPDSIETVVRHGRDLVASTQTLLNIAPRASELPRPRPAVDPAPVEPSGIFARPAGRPSEPPVTAGPGATTRPPAPEPDPVSAPSATGGDVLERIVGAMFDGERLSFETDEALAEIYGTTIEWTGAVRSARPFHGDADLGAGAGVKLQATVAEHVDELLGATRIDAVVGLPDDIDVALNRNDQVRFSGTIVRIDSIMRTIYVRNARLL